MTKYIFHIICDQMPVTEKLTPFLQQYLNIFSTRSIVSEEYGPTPFQHTPFKVKQLSLGGAGSTSRDTASGLVRARYVLCSSQTRFPALR